MCGENVRPGAIGDKPASNRNVLPPFRRPRGSSRDDHSGRHEAPPMRRVAGGGANPRRAGARRGGGSTASRVPRRRRSCQRWDPFRRGGLPEKGSPPCRVPRRIHAPQGPPHGRARHGAGVPMTALPRTTTAPQPSQGNSRMPREPAPTSGDRQGRAARSVRSLPLLAGVEVTRAGAEHTLARSRRRGL